MESVGEQPSEGRILFGERHGSKNLGSNSKRREELQIGISCRDPTEGCTETYSCRTGRNHPRLAGIHAEAYKELKQTNLLTLNRRRQWAGPRQVWGQVRPY